MIEQLTAWLAATRISVALVGISHWAEPALQIVHILALSVLMASIVMLDLRLIGLAGRDLSVAATARRLLPRMWGALAVQAATGVTLVVTEPKRELLDSAFQLKLILLAVAVAVTISLQRKLKCQPDDRAVATSSKVLAILSLGLWVAILICGRWIAYTQYE